MKTVMFNKNLLTNDTSQFARRPDVFYLDRNIKKAYIFDVTIVNDENISKGFIKSINKYKPL